MKITRVEFNRPVTFDLSSTEAWAPQNAAGWTPTDQDAHGVIFAKGDRTVFVPWSTIVSVSYASTAAKKDGGK